MQPTLRLPTELMRSSAILQQDEAAEHLQYAFQHCLGTAHANQRRILTYLVPVNMVYMRLPSPRLLQQHNLPLYVDIAEVSTLCLNHQPNP